MIGVRGFTLIELIFTLAIAAILAAMAVPSFNSFLLRNKVQSETQSLRADLSFARSKAVAGSQFITICASSDGLTCNHSNDWSGGWIVFEDNGSGGSGNSGFANISKNNSEKLLRVTQQLKNLDINATDSDGEGVQGIMFGPRGYVEGMRRAGADTDSLKTTLKICEPGGDSGVARAVWMDITGRSATSQDSDSSGVHEDVLGADLSC